MPVPKFQTTDLAAHGRPADAKLGAYHGIRNPGSNHFLQPLDLRISPDVHGNYPPLGLVGLFATVRLIASSAVS